MGVRGPVLGFDRKWGYEIWVDTVGGGVVLVTRTDFTQGDGPVRFEAEGAPDVGDKTFTDGRESGSRGTLV